MNKKVQSSAFKTLKFPLRWLFQIINISLLLYLIISIFSQKIKWENPYDIIFVISLFTEIFSIIYLVRNKYFYYIGKDKTKYLIRRKHLTSDEQRETSEGLIVDHYRFDDKTIDVLNALDILLSLPDNKEIQSQIKNKVLTYPKYQIKKLKMNFKVLCVYYYLIEFQNGKKKRLLIFNNLEDNN